MKLISPPLIIIGMHRSGTSMLARILDKAGVYMGYDLTNDHESWYFQRVNTAWMDREKLTWDNPSVPEKADLKLFNTYSFLRHYARITLQPLKPISFLSSDSWGWKDPRNTFTVSQWLRIFPKAKVIHIFRNGMDVAISLYRRNLNFDFTDKWHSARLENKLEGLKLWEEYAAQAYKYDYLFPGQVFHVCFEKLISGDENSIMQLESFTNCKLSEFIKQEIDSERTARFNNDEHRELMDFAQNSEWMHKLNYL